MCLVCSPEGKYIISGSFDGDMKLWDIASGREIRTLHGHRGQIRSVSFSSDGKYAVSGADDGTLRIWNVSTGQWTAYMQNSDNSKWLIFNSDGYWDSSAAGGDLVAMVSGIDCWNIDQFAVVNNRPDLILSGLPGKDNAFIAHYKNQYLKRLKKLGFTDSKNNPDEKLVSRDYHVPVSVITSAVTDKKFTEIKYTLSDSLYNLKRYNIFVNDVPLFGTYGKEISGTSATLSDKIELTAGINKIEVYCMNEKGTESYRAFITAEYKGKSPKPDLYYIGFGVSKYKNSNLNLGFADKDAKDLADLYVSMKGSYGNVYIRTFLNEEVTIENIRNARDLLKNAKPDDTFVLFIAGHGIHDKDREATYYYVTHETDIDNLSKTAANFGLVEDILQGIGPRNKLFLMDTCESGEVDDAVSDGYLAMADSRGIKSRVIDKRGFAVKGKQKKESKRSYLLDNDRYIYNDLVRRSGAVVFSSSKGGEFSYESDKIQNDYFTKAVIDALRGNGVEVENGSVSVDELRKSVISKVAKDTDNLQHPTVDRDNLFQKFGFPVD